MPQASPTLVERHTDLMSRLTAVIQEHGVDGDFKLLYAPQGLPLEEGEMLVQKVDPERRVIELHPTPLREVTLSDVLHDTQTVCLSDESFTTYAEQPSASDCVTGYHEGRPFHLYVM
ncbi:hypothetical protein [Streptomyces sp. SP18BB07]|uniref:hypothetical protein n=1 Tax=Streptomyces sp. SP18BB07 TaxID=3002522 RepID=UPI002E77FA3E|nr:hypothetical protein [Streptomyces sp. SP18BB07]MEE1764393.1 hypothetical protein [Streptomyces sp. SP18BB07]